MDSIKYSILNVVVLCHTKTTKAIINNTGPVQFVEEKKVVIDQLIYFKMRNE